MSKFFSEQLPYIHFKPSGPLFHFFSFSKEKKKQAKYLWAIFRILWRHHHKTVLEVSPTDRKGKAERLQWGCAVSRCFSFSLTKWASSLEIHFCRRASRRVRLAAQVPSGFHVHGSARLLKLQLFFRLPLRLLPPPWHLHAPPGPTSSLPVGSRRNTLYMHPGDVCVLLSDALSFCVCL